MGTDAGDLHLSPRHSPGYEKGPGLDTVAQDRVFGRVHLVDAVHPYRGAPRPFYVGPHAHQELAEIDYLRLTGDILESGGSLRHHSGHQEVLGGSHTGIVEEHVDGMKLGGRDLDEAVVQAHHPAHVGQAAQVDVDLTGTQVAAPRHGHAGPPEARHQRTHDLDGSPHALHQLIRSHLRLHSGGVDRQGAVGEVHHRPQVLQHLLHGADILDVRHVVQDTDTGRQKRCGHKLEGGVLRARNGHLSFEPVAAAYQETRLPGCFRHLSSLSATFSRL